jgi:hypothetical protein
MYINIFILCFNESVLLPHTVNHYRKHIPSCKITIYDNKSTDNSVEIATSLGCDVITFDSDNSQNEYIQRSIRNNCWQQIKDGWIIAIDMDEWLCITEKELKEELDNNTTILDIKGIDMIGESVNLDLSDIDLHTINRAVDNSEESKALCFLREQIEDMNYICGGHKCYPVGNIKYSSKTYINKHMSLLGLPFLINKNINRYNRSIKMREVGLDHHYSVDINKITYDYKEILLNSYILQ